VAGNQRFAAKAVKATTSSPIAVHMATHAGTASRIPLNVARSYLSAVFGSILLDGPSWAYIHANLSSLTLVAGDDEVWSSGFLSLGSFALV
jgi:hypothetical protein